MIDDPIKNNTVGEHRKTLVETIKDYLPNPVEMIIDQIIQWYNRRILIFSSLMMIVIPIYMISIGIIFFHSCPKSFYLPLHMIICGITSLIAAILLLSIAIIWKKAIKLTSNLTGNKEKYMIRIFSIFEIIFICIDLIGLIILTIVLVSISNTNSTSGYCHPILYYSSYILLFLIYSLLSIIMIIFFLIFYAYQRTK